MPAKVLDVSQLGFTECARALKELSETFGTSAGERAVTGALIAISRPVVNTARDLAPNDTVRKGINARQVRVRVGGHTRGRAIYQKVAFAVRVAATGQLAHLFEFGTAPRYQQKGTNAGHYTGRMRAQPFMRPAWTAHRYHLTRDFAPLIFRHIQATARRLRARGLARASLGMKP